jgi:Co/Zn/Cd efflux system component
MGVACCASDDHQGDRYRKILWWALGANVIMFLVEIIAAWHAASASLLADSMDFMADSANYAITLLALGLSARTRSKVGLAKGCTMMAYGLIILAFVALRQFAPHPPLASMMGIVALLALMTNLSVALLLFRFRVGDSNRRSVWLCTRNDAIANVAVLLAALGVWLTQAAWPDTVVGCGVGLLGLWSGYHIIRQAWAELR